MGIAVSTDFILGLIIGVLVVLLFQQLTRATSGLGRWLPLILLGVLGCAAIWLLLQVI
jgi:multisubunit Na+/H+ antiporter MnhE subunit